MTVISILTLQVPPDRRDEVVDYYSSARILESSGATSARLALAVEDPGRIIVIGEWPDVSAYDTWLAAAERLTFAEGVARAAGGDVTATNEVFTVRTS
ncbi:hypothetical protein BN12_100029 [Nostocoides japonicum T1-X7]|uniref:ABM domain-containing protein n=1 Tax=Nostocoides japonicum T1-X7 TaxID=1194083 RepID=A0A077LVK9_9MICO|nr:antibiotic biosynthesis monooxygenase [Tetrasphaera japonica]CCH76000.1 hypothetical protein BN12_100029 [Tetrasphaera japonica T1-X7]